MNISKNSIVTGSEGRPMAADVFFTPSNQQKPIVIYAHGFNGFKDWANFDLIAAQFAEAGFVFVKFNFSHNGTTPSQPEEFVEPEAYGNNNYSKELDDLGLMIDWILEFDHGFLKEMDTSSVYLLGHSLGGGIALLKAAEDRRVKRIVTWAAISECKTPWTNWPQQRIDQWRTSGVEYSVNSRTKQNLPLYFQLYEDYQLHENRLQIEAAVRSLKIPVLFCHGTADEAVPLEKAYQLKFWLPGAELFVVDSDHVFGRKHPWPHNYLPEPMQAVVDKTIEFFKKTD